ncbi:MAG: hypothetical protein ACK5CU_05295 [Rhodoluna sp.]|jgi:hypothetical protein
MKTKLIALSAIALLSASAAVPALGYPAGQAPVLGLSSASRIIPGDNITVQVSRVKAGCSVTVFWVGEGISSGAKTVKANGKTGAFSLATPGTAGTYTLSTNSISTTCSGGDAVTLTKSVTVGRLASIVTKVSSTSAFSSKNPTFSASGTVKSGSVAVASQTVTLSLRKDGTEVKSTTATTNGSGQFSKSFTGTTYAAGDYTVVVTLESGAVYASSTKTSAKLKLR